MHAVLDAALPIFALILVGYLVGRRGILGPSVTDALNRFVVWLALPALMFKATAQIGWDDIAHWGFLAAFTIGIAVTMTLGGLGRKRLADFAVEGLDAGYANVGYMGIPLAMLAFGDQGLAPAIVASVLTACVQFAVGIVLIELDLQREQGLGATVLKVGRTLATNPLLVAPVAGLVFALFHVPLPAPALNFIALLGGAASPCALVTIGLFLAQERGVSAPRTVGKLVLLKLVVQPAITGVLAFWVFDMPAVWGRAAVLLAALPTGTGPFMLAKLYDRAPGITARAIFVSTIASVVTVSALVAWFGRP